MIFRISLILTVTLMLQGCFFIFIPGSVIDATTDAVTGEFGNMCIGTAAVVGSKITLPDGKLGTVQKISGTSSRCTQTTMPIRATVTEN